MYLQEYIVKTMNSHVIVVDTNGNFIESADNYEEAMQDIQNGDL